MRHPATRSDVWPQSCLDKAKNILAWLKTIPTALCSCNRTASKSRMTFALLFSPNEPARSGRYKVVWRLGSDVGAKFIDPAPFRHGNDGPPRV